MKRFQITTVALDMLVPHPLQTVYDEVSAEERASLRASIAKHGLDALITVFAPSMVGGRRVHVVLDGWRRVEAFKSLGKVKVRVRVRLDLPGPDSKDGRLAFLRANFERRQLDNLQRVRVAIKQYEIIHAGGRALSQEQLGRAREDIGELLGLSGRNVARYLRVLRTPAKVQRAVSTGRLSLILAERVADAGADVQESIGKILAGSGNAKDVNAAVTRLLTPEASGTRQHVNPANALAAMVRNVVRGIQDLAGRVDELSPRRIAEYLPQIAEARRLLRALHDRAMDHHQ